MKYLKYFLESYKLKDFSNSGRYNYYVNRQKIDIKDRDNTEYINELYELFYDIADKHHLERISDYLEFKKTNFSYIIMDDLDPNRIFRRPKNMNSEVQFEYTIFIQSPTDELYKDLDQYIKKLREIGYISYYYAIPDDEEQDGEEFSFGITKYEFQDLGNFGGIIRIKVIVE